MFGHKDGFIETKLKRISEMLERMGLSTRTNPIRGGPRSSIDNQRKAIKAEVDKLIRLSEEIHDFIEKRV